MQTDRRTEIPTFIREKNMFRPLPPKLRIFNVDLYRSFEAQKMVFGPALLVLSVSEYHSTAIVTVYKPPKANKEFLSDFADLLFYMYLSFWGVLTSIWTKKTALTK